MLELETSSDYLGALLRGFGGYNFIVKKVEESFKGYSIKSLSEE